MAAIADNGVCEGLVNLVRRVSSDDSVKNAVGRRFMLQLHSFFLPSILTWSVTTECT